VARPPLLNRVAARLRDLALLLRFLGRYRSVWLSLLVGLLLVLSLVMYVVQSAAVAPYVYPLF
jgi:hypothetical protein